MSDSSFTLLYKLRFVLGSALVLVGLFLLSIILSITTTSYKVHAASAPSDNAYAASASDNPNVVADFMSTAGSASMKVISSAQKSLNSGLHGVAVSIASVPINGSKAAAKGAYSGIVFIGNGVGDTASFVAHIPGKVVGLASPSNIVSSTIKPADNLSIPAINAPKTTVAASIGSSPPPAPAPAVSPPGSDTSPQWPIHGAVTTLFGVPEWPYEAIHTGVDISDGKPSGITPIKPFKPGKVVQVIRGGGLGNHVVVDHGGGITSVYGHLYSISVQVGQTVGKSTVIGYEGTTGVSTGPHLHFEIHLNGQPVNPFNYIPGRP